MKSRQRPRRRELLLQHFPRFECSIMRAKLFLACNVSLPLCHINGSTTPQFHVEDCSCIYITI
jgi:hypothetical protein